MCVLRALHLSLQRRLARGLFAQQACARARVIQRTQTRVHRRDVFINAGDGRSIRRQLIAILFAALALRLDLSQPPAQRLKLAVTQHRLARRDQLSTDARVLALQLVELRVEVRR